tara:strand:+ start:1570 stop:2385 length:816 start_codon:yes stop_codon:yes gene_type:complete
MKKITTILSLGAGVQSSALALMAAKGEVTPMPDVAVFADTGYEPKAVYDWLDWLEKQLPFKVARVSRGNLRQDQINTRVRSSRGAALPYFTLNKKDGSVGMLQRQCTAEYKINPVTKYTREHILGLKRRQRFPKEHVVDLWYGISYDEIQRQKVPFVEPWRRNVYPLIEKRIYRGQCLEWMKKNNYPEPPRSACLCCPFHNNHEWLKIKNGPKKEWEDVIQFDKAIRKLGGVDGDLFLHRSCKPLDKIDFYTLSNSAQMSLLDECEGYCGV